MRVRELMTERVITIAPEVPIKDVAGVMVANGISGLPVCDSHGGVLGVVSEHDILYKEHVLTAAKAMTSPAITVAPYESVAQAARIMCERRVNRLPVVKDGRLVGIVTRADLVRAFTRTDAEIEREIREDVLQRTMWIETGSVDVSVESGQAVLSGRLHTRTDVELLTRLAGRVPGVVAVRSAVAWDVDDTTRKGRRALQQPVR